jgi:hypothetical protein
MRRLREISGMVLVIAGLAGCMLPIIPGIPLVIAGLTLHPELRTKMRWLERWGELLADRLRLRPKESRGQAKQTFGVEETSGEKR